MDEFQGLHDRIDRVLAHAEGVAGDRDALAEINDLLCEGYARALEAEAALIRLEERLADGIAAAPADRAVDIRAIAREHRSCERAVARLRARLATAHERFLALGGAARIA